MPETSSEADFEDFPDLAVLEMFLARRLRLADMRRAADKVAVSDDVRESLDDALAETEEASRMLLANPSLPTTVPMDELFNSEFLLLCLELRIDLLSWINRPEVLIRLEDPEVILRRYANLANAYDIDIVDMDSSMEFAEKVDQMEHRIRKTFDLLRRSGRL